jgi:hypothetical protein
MRAQRAQKAGAPILAHRTANSTCPVCTGHPGGPTSQKLQRSNGSDDVAGGTGLSGVHRTVRCTPDSVRCAKEEPPQELASFGNCQRLVRYNSPDMSGVHRTVRCNSGATANSRQRLPAEHLMRAQRAQKAGVPILAHRTVNSTCPVCTGHLGGPTSQKLQRSESNGTGDVAGAPDMSGVHRTVRCAIEQTAPPTVTFGGWGYKYPNHPTIHCIQVFHSPTTTRALAFNSRHTKEIKSSPNSTQRHSD